MTITELSESQIRDYFSRLFAGLKDKSEQLVKCPWHDDSTASLSINTAKGLWKCHAGCGEGGLIDFEARMTGSDKQTAYRNIMQTLGITVHERNVPEEPEAIYPYTDPMGKAIFKKLRYPGKKFFIRHQDESGHWVFKVPAGPRPLYCLPELITANITIIVEGERDADNVSKADLSQFDSGLRVSATTNFDGAGKWDPRYSPYFSGKLVFILRDNDPVGKAHGLMVAESVYGYAHAVHIVDLPGLLEHGDVSDFLASHTPRELWAEILKTLPWHPQKSELVISAPKFLLKSSPDIDWLVDGVVQRGSNGFIAAPPKSAKSWVALDMAIAIASGGEWLGFQTNRAPVALISREDNPNLTRWRLGRLLTGRAINFSMVENLWINSKDQSPQFRLDNPEQLREMIEALKIVKPELVLLDVMNILHGADENDNTEMRKVMDCADTLHKELKASIGILHHFNKMSTGRITERLRGSSGIAGWAEWVVGIKYASDKEDEKTRMAQFDVKAGNQSDPIYFEIKTEGQMSKIEIIKQEKSMKKKNKVDNVLSSVEQMENLDLGS